jgi:hypothetical protein
MVRKRKKDKPEKPSLRLRHTHYMIIPFWDDREERRFVPICTYRFHHGVINHLQTQDHLCSQGCKYFRKYLLENNHAFDQDFLIENSKNRCDNNSRVQRLIPFIEKSSPPYFWVLDRGDRLYFLKYKKLGIVQDLERDHFKMHIDNLDKNYSPPRQH